MLSFSMPDLLRAVVLLVFIEGFFYTFFPKHIQGFAMRCLIDANPANLRLFGMVLFGLGFFLTVLLDGTP
ncbi:MAG: DUF2065 family protein [Alphaproteobacteria bacterium]|nr:DUF2065 family protein [Alphaproteobacteria bacterium]